MCVSILIILNLSCVTYFRPILFTLKSQAFETNLLLSTLSPDCDSQSDSSVVSRQIQSVRRKNASSRSTSRCVNKSSRRIKKSEVIKPEVNDVFKSRLAEERNKSDKTLNQNMNASMNIVSANNSTNGVRERDLHMPEQSHRSVALGSVNTTSVTDRNISKDRKLINSVFSNITKRKSTNDEKDYKEGEVAVDCIDLEENVPQSPPRQVAKKARLVFQKCFQNTFDPRMLPGHDTILVEDSDENNSD